MAWLFSCFTGCGSKSHISPPIVETVESEKQIPEEVLVNIFLNSSPIDLALCSRVCQCWHQTINRYEMHFHLKFNEGLVRLVKEEKKSYLIPQPSLFYPFLKSLPSESRQQIRENPKSIQRFYEPFPDHAVFGESREDLKKFPYTQMRATLIASYEAGILAMEDPAKNRFVSLAAFFGDFELVNRLLSESHLKEEVLKDLVKTCIILAAEGKQPEAIRALKNRWKISPRETIMFNFDLVAFAQSDPEMAKIIAEES